MDSGDTGVTAESPTVTTEAAESGQAPSAPVAPAAQTVPYERFQQVNSQMRQFERMARETGTTVQQLQRELQELKSKSQAPAGSPQEQFEKQQAASALRDLIAEHPELKPLLDLAKSAPHLLQSAQGVQSLRQSQEQALHRQGRDSITSLVKAENLPTDAKFVRRIENLVAAEIAEMDGGRERYLQGDLSVIQDAFNAIKPDFLALLSRPAAQSVIQTKTNVRQLPPVARGGGPGQEPPPTLKDGDERGYMAQLRNRASKLLDAAGR